MDDLLCTWVSGLRAQSRHTARSYEACVRRFLDWAAKPVEELTPRDAAAYVGSLADSGLSRASVAHHISAVRTFLKYAQSLGVLPAGPLDMLKRPRVAITSMNRYLTEDEAKSLLAGARQVSHSAHLAVAVMLTTGVRVSELAGAEWRHLFRDPQGRLGLLVLGKGNKERVCAITDDLWALLVADRERRGLSVELSTKDRSPLVAARHGGAPTPSTLWRWVRAAARAAGLDKDASPHWLRHSFGTLAALGGAPVYAVQAAMGHASITTSQRYVHWVQGLADSAALHLPAGLL